MTNLRLLRIWFNLTYLDEEILSTFTVPLGHIIDIPEFGTTLQMHVVGCLGLLSTVIYSWEYFCSVSSELDHDFMSDTIWKFENCQQPEQSEN